MSETVSISIRDRVAIVTIKRPQHRNAVDLPTAQALLAAFKSFDANDDADVAILTGAAGAFCAGTDLKALAPGERKPVNPDGEFAPMGPTRLRLRKPVVAAVEGHPVAGGMELALWCDLGIVGRSAILGIFNRRFGVLLVDLGTIRLPRIIGLVRAL
jgi:enoyl-CoA hydratase